MNQTVNKSHEIRSAFLDFFRQRGHRVVPSSSLVPAGDPSLLFTNSGMVQFKDIFLGNVQSDYQRAVSCQRCLRAGGKHNDLENVGYTRSHHTFFEMLGNFSFGDYSKREAIIYAWDFLEEVLRLPPEKLWVTVYKDDHEAAEIWLNETGIDRQRISLLGEADNFWAMGKTGPCGPCAEVYYDRGPEVKGGPPGSGEDGERFVEIWNLVFMLHERDEQDQLHDLPRQCVDTGMGLERISAVMQGVESNFETDLFTTLLRRVAELLSVDGLDHPSLKVIADHARACTFLIADGVFPANDGHGYVLRRIIRRAIRHGHKLGARRPFFHQLAGQVIKEMHSVYPELLEPRDFVMRVLESEELRFAETLDEGLKILEAELPRLSGSEIPGEFVFKLFDTYGFPADLTADIAREKNLQVDLAGFETAMRAQRSRSRAAAGFRASRKSDTPTISSKSIFCGYQSSAETVRLLEMFVDGNSVDRITQNQDAVVVLDKTPFYAEGGGQLGDTGHLENRDGFFAVHDTQKRGHAIMHYGTLQKGTIQVGEAVFAQIDQQRRANLALNHSATHLMNAALRQVLGKHVAQKGSLVAPDRLRFDFSHDRRLSEAEKAEIEALVNQEIRRNSEVQVELLPREKAIAKGAQALFGEKYEDEVRVLSMGKFSIELCGGTHVSRTGDIGLFKIISDSAIAAGVRRIEALSGEVAYQHVSEAEQQLKEVALLLKTEPPMLLEKVKKLLAERRALAKRPDKERGRSLFIPGMLNSYDVNGVKVLTGQLPKMDRQHLRQQVDLLKGDLDRGVVVVASAESGKVRLAVGVTQEMVGQIHAGRLASSLAEKLGGKGGGRANMAEAGGDKPDAIEDVLSQVPTWVRARIS